MQQPLLSKAIFLFAVIFGATSFSTAQTSPSFSHPHATLLADGGQGIVMKFDFADPTFMDVETPDGDAIIPTVGDDTPLLVKGAPSLTKSAVAIMIDGQSNTAFEVLNSTYTDYTDIEIAPSKGNVFRNVEPSDV